MIQSVALSRWMIVKSRYPAGPYQGRLIAQSRQRRIGRIDAKRDANG
jgi:hypothetical protein